jgi:uncharacterized protein YigE (DUF2233 family)
MFTDPQSIFWRWFWIVAWVCGLLLSAEASAAPNDWQTIESGLSYKKITIGTGDDAIELHALKINPHHFSVKPIFSEHRVNVRTMQESSHALAVINANFFDRNGEALGAVVLNGKELHAKKNISWWSVFCINHKGKAEIVPSQQDYKGLCEQAVQSGPRLAVNGQMPPIKDEVSRKSAVGINWQGEIVIVASGQAIGIHKLAQIFLTPENQGGLDCPDALNLDGGASSQFYMNAPGLKLTLPGFSAVPVGLGVFAK